MADWLDEMRVNQGGLMRCCLASLAEQLGEMEERPPEGTILDCKYEKPGNGNLILEGNTWKWNR